MYLKASRLSTTRISGSMFDSDLKSSDLRSGKSNPSPWWATRQTGLGRCCKKLSSIWKMKKWTGFWKDIHGAFNRKTTYCCTHYLLVYYVDKFFQVWDTHNSHFCPVTYIHLPCQPSHDVIIRLLQATLKSQPFDPLSHIPLSLLSFLTSYKD